MISLLIFIGILFVVAILVIWLLSFLDKWMRVNILLMFTKWHNADDFIPPRKYRQKGVYLWQKRKFFIWRTVYVGQSVNMSARYKQHITGKGCPQIFKDYKRDPSKLRFKAISMKKAHYTNLNALEKRLIIKYNTVDKGYNKTAGNGKHRY